MRGAGLKTAPLVRQSRNVTPTDILCGEVRIYPWAKLDRSRQDGVGKVHRHLLLRKLGDSNISSDTRW